MDADLKEGRMKVESVEETLRFSRAVRVNVHAVAVMMFAAGWAAGVYAKSDGGDAATLMGAAFAILILSVLMLLRLEQMRKTLHARIVREAADAEVRAAQKTGGESA